MKIINLSHYFSSPRRQMLLTNQILLKYKYFFLNANIFIHGLLCSGEVA